MKRILTLAAALTLITTLTACSSGAHSEPAVNAASQAATEAATTSDNNDDTAAINPFETLSISAEDVATIDEYSHYPSTMKLAIDYGEKDYRSDVLYDITIISADDKAIQIGVDAELKPDSANSYSLSSSSKTFEISVDDILSHLLNKEMLSDESFSALEQELRSNIINSTGAVDDIELVATYECLPVEKPALENYVVIEDNNEKNYNDWMSGISFVEDTHISDGFRVFCIYKLSENKYAIISACPVFLNSQVIIERSSIKTTAYGMTDNTFDSQEAAYAAIESWVSHYNGVELTER